MKRFILILCIVGILPLGGWTQTPRELLEVALQGNPQRAALHMEYQASLEKIPQIRQLPDFQLGVGGFLLPVETRLGPQQTRLSASQMFPWFGTLQVQEDQARAQAEVQKERTTSYELDLYYQIQKACFQLYEIDQSQMIVKRNQVLLESLKGLAESQVASGKATVADGLLVELKRQALEQEIKLLESQKRKPVAVLNQLLNRPLDASIVPMDTLEFAILPGQMDSLFAEIRQQNPQLQLLSLQQEVSRQALKVNHKMGQPILGLGVDYLVINARTDAFPSNNGRDALQLKAMVSIPLDRKKYTAKEREENLKIEALESRKEEALTQIHSAIEQAYADHEQAILLRELYLKQKETTEAAIQVLRTAYSQQGSRFEELLKLEGELIQYDLKELKTRVLSHLAKAEVERFVR